MEGRIRPIFIVLLVLVLLALPLKANAVVPPKFKLTLIPSYDNQLVQPGSVNKGALTVLNQGATIAGFRVYATPYSVTGENYSPDFTPIPNAPNISKWFTFNVVSGAISPGSLATITYTLTIPPSTPAGGYYGAVFVQTTLHNGSQKSNVLITQRVGELFYLQVAGPVTKKGNVVSWKASLLQDNPVVATLRLDDEGDIHYFSKEEITFSSLSGTVDYRATLTKVILPFTIRRIPIQWPNPPSFGLYKVSGIATTFGNHKLASHYILIISRSVRIKVAVIIGLILLYILFRSTIRPIIRGIIPKRNKTYRNRQK